MPSRVVAATAMTSLQLAGAEVDTSAASFPAAATIARVTPCASTEPKTLWYAGRQGPGPPRLTLITCAGYGFAGTPGTASPAAQAMPSMMSESSPPHLPSTRTGRTFAAQSIPATPMPLSEFAATTPLTAVPCHELSSTAQSPKSGSLRSFASIQSPGSVASASRPLPSFATFGSEMKS